MNNEIYYDTKGHVHIVSKTLSKGGQGIVYRTKEPNILLKLEFERNSNLEKISKCIKNNHKFNEIRFLPILKKTNITLPLTILKDYVGYTMKLLDGMVSFDEAFYKKNKFENEWIKDIKRDNEEIGEELGNYIGAGGLYKRIKAFVNVACIISKLHATGLVYCDLSDKNIFISSEINKAIVWLIDSDNLNFMKNTIKVSGWMTPGYGAPEIYKGKGNTMYSDDYSFAISLFKNLTLKHPFVGNALEEEQDDEEFIENCLESDEACRRGLPFILDSDDDSNETSSLIPFENVISNEMLECFQRTFSIEGRNNRTKRTTIFEWSYVLIKELDSLIKCKNCSMHYNSIYFKICPWCDEKTEIILIKSFNETNSKKWEFRKEKGNISVPLRVVNGFFVDEIDEEIFKIKIKNKRLLIYDLSEDFDFYLYDKEKSKLYGTVEFEIEQKVKITVEKDEEKRLLEIEVCYEN